MCSTNDPDEAIRRLAAGGLRGSREEFWAAFHLAWSRLERFAKYRVRRARARQDILKDCVQEFFRRVCRYRRSYRGTTEGEFWTWLGRICDNARRDVQKRERRQPRSFTDVDPIDPAVLDEAPQHANPVAAVEENEAFRALRDCLKRLDEVAQRLMGLRYFSPRLSQRATAEVLGCSAAQVFKLEHRARGVLLRCLQGKGIDYPSGRYRGVAQGIGSD